MVKIDLHCHVIEQKRSVIEFFKECAEQGVEIVAITDHKTLKVFTERIHNLTPEELKQIPLSIRVVVGIEMTGKYKYTNSAGQTSWIAIDMLGYNIDLSKEEELNSWIAENYVDIDSKEFQSKELNRLIQIAQKMEWQADWEALDIDKDNPNKCFAGRAIAEALIDEKYRKHNLEKGLAPEIVENTRNFFNFYCKRPEAPFYLDVTQYFPDIGEVIDILKRCGGMVFVPHIAAYSSKKGDNNEVANAWEDSQNLAEVFVREYKGEIHGIEVIHPQNDSPKDEFAEFLYKLAEENGIYVSGGTDYHQPGETLGKDKKGRPITNERLPGIENWVKPYTIVEIWEMTNKSKESNENSKDQLPEMQPGTNSDKER